MNRQDLAARVRALLSKTQANGATEAEALSAAAKARELMDKYHLDHGSLGMEEEGTQRYDQPFGNLRKRVDRRAYEVKKFLFQPIGQFTDTKGWHSGNNSAFSFFGLRSDTDFAGWLLESLSTFVIQQAIAYEVTRLLDSDDAHEVTEDEERSFLDAACRRIRERLFDLARERTGSNTGRELISLKNVLVQRDFDKLGIRFNGGVSVGMGGRHSGAAAAGRSAGDRASFGRPVGGHVSGLLGGR